MAYPKELREACIIRMMPPQSQTIARIHKETGIPEVTLKSWQAKARKQGYAVPANDVQSERWSSLDKFLIVMETASLSEVELAEYCRKKGLYIEQVNEWKDNCANANGSIAQQILQSQRREKELARELKRTQRDLQRKESALAEAAVLLVLRKKAEAIWGPRDEDA